MYFYKNNKNVVLPFDDNINIDNVQNVFMLYNNKKIGFNRNGNFFIENYTLDLKLNVSNYDMKIIKSKTIRHDIISNHDEIFSYNLGYELISNNENYTYIIQILSNEIVLYAKRINGEEVSEKYIPLL